VSNEELTIKLEEFEKSFSTLAKRYEFVRRSDGTVDWNGVYEFAKAAFGLAKSSIRLIGYCVQLLWAWATGELLEISDANLEAFISGHPA